jgi:hypothetical protein
MRNRAACCMKSLQRPLLLAPAAIAVATALAYSHAWGAQEATPPAAQTLKDETIAYVVTDMHWAIWESKDGKTECPHGFNYEGPREEFKQLFPSDSPQRSFAETHLRREIDSWYPTTAPEPFEFRDAGGPTSYGMNLDGKVGPDDFTSPEGEPGVDNNLYRVVGCINNYRPPNGSFYIFDRGAIPGQRENRILIELTGVHSLLNDNDVQVTMYRGRDPLQKDATGERDVPGGSQRIDTRWGLKYIQHMRGKIVDGVLITDPRDLIYPWAVFDLATDEYMHAARLKLKLSPTHAEGLMAGYSDIESWYSQATRSYSTHYFSYGQESAPSIYKALRRLADGYPDSKTGANTAISSALGMSFVQVYIDPASKVVSASLPPQHPKPFGGPPFPRPAAAELKEYADSTASKFSPAVNAPEVPR